MASAPIIIDVTGHPPPHVSLSFQATAAGSYRGSSCEPLGRNTCCSGPFFCAFMLQKCCAKTGRANRDFRPFHQHINMAFSLSRVSGGESLKGWAGTQVPALFFCPPHSGPTKTAEIRALLQERGAAKTPLAPAGASRRIADNPLSLPRFRHRRYPSETPMTRRRSDPQPGGAGLPFMAPGCRRGAISSKPLSRNRRRVRRS